MQGFHRKMKQFLNHNSNWLTRILFVLVSLFVFQKNMVAAIATPVKLLVINIFRCLIGALILTVGNDFFLLTNTPISASPIIFGHYHHKVSVRTTTLNQPSIRETGTVN